MRTSGSTAQVVLGLVVVTVGVLLTLDNLGYVYASDYLRFWPAAVVVYGVARLFNPRSNQFWSGVWIVLGSLMVLDRLDLMEFRLHDWWPVILIAMGGAILWGSMRTKGMAVVVSASRGEDNDDVIDITAIMGGVERNNSSKDFRGGKITAIMGGCELDLRQAEMKQDAVLEVFAMWGGISLRVPPSWTVTVKGLPIMGGFSDETTPPRGDAVKRLTIQGNAVMGGVEVKN